MKRLYFSKLVILLVILSGLCFSGIAQTTTFTFNGTTGIGSSGISGSPQSYNVPLGVSQIGVDMYGGCGGWPCCSWASGGGTVAPGGRVQCTMNVTPGTTLYIYVGGAGANNLNSGTQCPGGWNGGGVGGAVGSSFCAGGGGETDIRTSTSGAYATSVLVVAGAGGGGGDFSPIGGAGGGTIGGTGQTVSLSTSGGACGGGQTGPSCTTGSGLGAQGQGGTCTCYSDGGGGAGWWGGNGGTAGDGGGAGGSSYPATPNSVVTAIVHTQGYPAAIGNGQVTITVLCQAPGAIVGSTPVCPGANITLTNPTGTAGGTWISSNPAVASISPTSGVVTGNTAGVTTITYSETNPCGGVGALATAVVTVNPLPGAITGANNVCTSFTTNLSDGGVGTWVSSNTAVATVSSSGVVSGLTAGVTTISYTLSTGCAPATYLVTVNTFPAAIVGTPSVCASGGTTALTDALTGGTWNSSSSSIASVAVGTGIVTGNTVGTANITYTAPTGCTTSVTVTVNPLPVAISGAASVCAGATTTLTDGTAGGTWTSSNSSQASVGIGSGIVTGIVTGLPTITYTLAGTGCRTTIPMAVNPLPGAITGSSAVCASATTVLSDAGGGTWSSSNTAAATVNAFTGLISGIAPGTTTITYSLTTGCSVSTTMLVNPIPTPYSLIGGGSYCAGSGGLHVGLSYAGSGINYVLYNGGSPVSTPYPGSNAGLDFGLQTAAGSYSVVGTNAVTGCSGPMGAAVTISVNPPPGTHNMSASGSYCAGTSGSPIGTDGSDVGVNYQVYNSGAAVGSVIAGTGSGLSLGNFTAGSYTIVATNPITGCSQPLSGGPLVISVAPSPTLYIVTGGGDYCAGAGGVHVSLSGSDAGTVYQLYNGTGTVGGSVYSIVGGVLDFGLQSAAGTYTVIATNPSLCPGRMAGSATVIIDPLPTVTAVTGGGGYCSGSTGTHIGLAFSSPGINYKLLYSGGVIATVPGSGSGVDFGAETVSGTYTVIATNAITGCSNTMGSTSVIANPLPNSFIVYGGGSYCSGGTGFDIATNLSQAGISYQLYNGGVASGLPVTGSPIGAALDFGMFTTAGTYTAIARNTVTGCSAAGTGSATIAIFPLPPVHSVTGGGNYCVGGTGVHVGVNGSNTGKIYQLITSGGIVMTMTGTGSALDFGLQSATGSYTVMAIDTITGCQKLMNGSATIGTSPLPAVDTVTGGGSLCAGATGVAVGLNGSSTGVSYQLINGSTPVGSPRAGSGSALNFGLQTAGGTYVVLATGTLTGCGITMSGTATVSVNPLPAAQTISGGGNYCTGGTGKDVILTGSATGVNYQLFNSGAVVGTAVAGTGDSLDFGLNTAGIYTATAIDAVTGCSSVMTGRVTVGIVSPSIYNVTGGGSYCTGGSGVAVGQSGSSIGVTYLLYRAGAPVGSPVSGTGTALSFGIASAAGSYTVQATDVALGCIVPMADSAVIVVNSLPMAEPVSGGGSFCAGATAAHIGLSASVTGVNYQLYNASGVAYGSPVHGATGSTVDFGAVPVAGTYTVTATDGTTGCVNHMTGSATITILPTPVPYTVTADNYGNYCASDSGLHIRLSNSQSTATYQLFRSSAPVGATIAGNGSALDMGLQMIAGSYTIVATNITTMCIANMLGSAPVNIVPLPIVHNVTGGGAFCPGGAGVSVGQDGSDAGVYYQLYNNGTTLLRTVYGTGMAIDYGLQTAIGNYTIVGSSEVTTCDNNMLGTAVVSYEVLLTPVVTLRSYPGTTGVAVGRVDSIIALVSNGGSNPTYQWYVNGHPIPGATNALFAGYGFFNNDSVTCAVTASGPCGGNTATKSVTVTLRNVSVSQVTGNSADVKLMPNPNKGVFTLKGTIGSMNEEVTMEITNMLGQVVYTNKVVAQGGNINEVIDLGNNLVPGMYILNMSATGAHTVLHFVVE